MNSQIQPTSEVAKVGIGKVSSYHRRVFSQLFINRWKQLELHHRCLSCFLSLQSQAFRSRKLGAQTSQSSYQFFSIIFSVGKFFSRILLGSCRHAIDKYFIKEKTSIEFIEKLFLLLLIHKAASYPFQICSSFRPLSGRRKNYSVIEKSFESKRKKFRSHFG